MSKAERRLLVLVGLVICAATLGWILLAPEWGLLRYRGLQSEITTLARENRELAERNAELEKEIDRLKNDETYLEEIARQKYGLLKENETVYEVK